VTLGVLDWGIGGFGLVSRLPPDAALCYLSDAGAPPYGTLDTEALCDRVAGGMRFLAAHGATHIVLACNAASSILDTLTARPVPVTGILDAGTRLALAAPGGTIGVTGGERTLAAGHHARALAAAGRLVRLASGQPLSALVEAGQLHGPTVEAEVQHVLDRLGPVDALLLACTHYPALSGVFQALRPGLPLLDPVDALLETLPATAAGVRRAWTTGDPVQTAWAAERVWGVTVAVAGVDAEGQKPFWRSAPKRVTVSM
jgi:glutamate racemase